eukprot:scaffold90685_cov69-Phaeocystis_antarctica.AAC.5
MISTRHHTRRSLTARLCSRANARDALTAAAAKRHGESAARPALCQYESEYASHASPSSAALSQSKQSRDSGPARPPESTSAPPSGRSRGRTEPTPAGRARSECQLSPPSSEMAER